MYSTICLVTLMILKMSHRLNVTRLVFFGVLVLDFIYIEISGFKPGFSEILVPEIF